MGGLLPAVVTRVSGGTRCHSAAAAARLGEISWESHALGQTLLLKRQQHWGPIPASRLTVTGVAISPLVVAWEGYPVSSEQVPKLPQSAAGAPLPFRMADATGPDWRLLFSFRGKLQPGDPGPPGSRAPASSPFSNAAPWTTATARPAWSNDAPLVFCLTNIWNSAWRPPELSGGDFSGPDSPREALYRFT